MSNLSEPDVNSISDGAWPGKHKLILNLTKSSCLKDVIMLKRIKMAKVQEQTAAPVLQSLLHVSNSGIIYSKVCIFWCVGKET